MTEKKLTYDELVERNRRLANKIINHNAEFEATLRAEIHKAKNQAWDEGYDSGWGDGHTGVTESNVNPYQDAS